jgi:hypothetical protein
MAVLFISGSFRKVPKGHFDRMLQGFRVGGASTVDAEGVR